METSLHHQDYETSSLNQIPRVYKKEVCSLKNNFNQFLNDHHYVDQSQSLVECCHCHYHVIITCFRISEVALFGCILNYQMNILRYFSKRRGFSHDANYEYLPDGGVGDGGDGDIDLRGDDRGWVMSALGDIILLLISPDSNLSVIFRKSS